MLKVTERLISCKTLLFLKDKKSFKASSTIKLRMSMGNESNDLSVLWKMERCTQVSGLLGQVRDKAEVDNNGLMVACTKDIG